MSWGQESGNSRPSLLCSCCACEDGGPTIPGLPGGAEHLVIRAVLAWPPLTPFGLSVFISVAQTGCSSEPNLWAEIRAAVYLAAVRTPSFPSLSRLLLQYSMCAIFKVAIYWGLQSGLHLEIFSNESNAGWTLLLYYTKRLNQTQRGQSLEATAVLLFASSTSAPH